MRGDPLLQRLDHVAIAVTDTENALRYFSDFLGLQVASSETLESPAVRLTYLDCGNAFIQLVEPLDEHSAIADFLTANGEGLHHICFGVADAQAAAAAYSDPHGPPVTLGQGRGMPSAFLSGEPHHGVRLECTQIREQHNNSGTEQDDE
jgi:methylmalonyl-CoA epimerase